MKDGKSESVGPVLRPGDITKVELSTQNPDLPIRVFCEGHDFAYDVAWQCGQGDAPELTGFAFVPLTGAAITKRDMLRVNPERLARAAAAAHTAPEDIRFHQEVQQRMNAGLAKKMAELGLDFDRELHGVRELTRFGEPAGLVMPARTRKAGRPQERTREFYRRIADAARDAEKQPTTTNITNYVHEQVKTWQDVGEVSRHAVQKWIKTARGLGLYEGPRQRTREKLDRITKQDKGTEQK